MVSPGIGASMGMIKRRKLLILQEVVGANGFEPSTSFLLLRSQSYLPVVSSRLGRLLGKMYWYK